MDEQTGITGWFKAHSTIIFLVIIGIVGGVAFLKKNNASSGSADVPLSETGDYSGLQRDSAGNPIIYRDVSDSFINIAVNGNPTQPVASAPPSPGHVEHPIEPTQPPPSGGGGSLGLLGPSVEVDFGRRTYRSPSVRTWTPIPIPTQDPLVPGSQGRVWYIDNGIQRLLTSGYGGPVNNDGVPAGNNSSSSGSTTQYNSSTQVTRNT